ncbi:uncharacterized protein LOC127252602 [Andrographis paniculata]|uniref:uncharacterized protein LOC127252602 n=1 Tax=Andrographis paniculata TaxID=175694 RepID=UPI0021E979B9|nr:uncharacterized protein LOC127252602 [Andrographis paniculata]
MDAIEPLRYSGGGDAMSIEDIAFLKLNSSRNFCVMLLFHIHKITLTVTAALHALTLRALIDYVCPIRFNGFSLHGGKQSNACELRIQVDLLGLKIDNPSYRRRNCLFRASLEDNENDHDRRMVVKYLEENPTMFEPFVEDEVPSINIANPKWQRLVIASRERSAIDDVKA